MVIEKRNDLPSSTISYDAGEGTGVISEECMPLIRN